jgi:RNA polymerase sigma factor (sigma-70 family)
MTTQPPWVAWVNDHRRALLSQARKLVYRQAEAEDLVQDCQIRLLRFGSHAAWNTDRQAVAYSTQIIKNVHRDDLSRRKRRLASETCWLTGRESDDTSAFLPGQAEDLECVRIAVARLPRELRDAVRAIYVQDLSPTQAARMLGCHPTTVDRRVEKALGILSRHLNVKNPPFRCAA